MKTIHILACIALLGCTDAAPAPAPQTQTAQPAPLQNAAEPVPTAPVNIPMYAPLPTVPQPNPPCTSCPFGTDVAQPH